jgi:hypothetical protein
MLNETIKTNNKVSNLTGDVNISAAADFNHLEFNVASGKWVNRAILTNAGDILPEADNTRSIGSLGANAAADRRFATVNAKNITATKKSGGTGTEVITVAAHPSITFGTADTATQATATASLINNVDSLVGGFASSKAANQTATIKAGATLTQAIVFGNATSGTGFNALIYGAGSGTMAIGHAAAQTKDAEISATTSGFARGLTQGGKISAGTGATAFGSILNPSTNDITATGAGSFAIGSATTASIIATPPNAFQFGPGTNAVAGLQVGDAQTRTASGVAVTGVLLRPTAGIDVISTVGLGTKTITHAGKGVSIASVNAATGTTNTITPSADGSFACATMGNPALTDPGNTSLIVSAPGGFAGGYISNPGTAGTTATISSTGLGGSFAHGWCQKGNSLINSSGKGSFANGWTYSDSTIKAFGSGSFVNGTAGGGGAKLYAQGNGSFVAGYADWAKGITAAGPGSMAIGFIYGTGSNTAVISTAAASKGSFAGGYSKTTGGTGNNIIQTTINPGSFAFGNIRVTGAGTGNNITASGLGAVALGNITATTEAGTKTITASGIGSLAIGSATSAIAATVENSFQFGPGTNNTVSSLQILDATSTGLIFKPTATISNTLNDITITSGPGAGANNKTLVLTYPVYDDIVVPLIVQSGSDNNFKPPSWVKYRELSGGSLGIYLWRFDNAVTLNENSLYFQVEMPHNKKLDTALDVHVHFTTTGTNNTNVRWALEYQWVKINEAFAANNTALASVNVPIGSTANVHLLGDMGDIAAPANETISSILVGRLYRQSGNAGDTFESNEVYLLNMGLHYQIDTLGSRQEGAK